MSNVLLTYYFLNSWLGSDHGPSAGFWQPHHRGLHTGGPGGGRPLSDHHSAIPLQCAACGHHAPGWRDVRAQQCASLAVLAPALTCHFAPLQTLCGQKCWEGHGTPLFSLHRALLCGRDVCRYSIGGGTTATIANPGDFVHLVYAAASNRWIVTSQKGTVFA
jgi:hypothetical protein